MSTTETAKFNEVEPYAYFKAILKRMTDGHPNNEIDDCFP
ncbi:MAG: transposase domain-containing protein [Alphaproteobacteria bacterium]